MRIVARILAEGELFHPERASRRQVSSGKLAVCGYLRLPPRLVTSELGRHQLRDPRGNRHACSGIEEKRPGAPCQDVLERARPLPAYGPDNLAGAVGEDRVERFSPAGVFS